MGELPPLHTPQGPDVPRALRPRFPRVDSSGTSRVPSSRSASFPFLASSSLRFSPLRSSSLFRGVAPPFAFSASFPFLPFPCVQFSPVLSTVRYRFLHGSLRPCSLVFPSASFPFLPFPCVQVSPVLSTSFPTPLPPASFPFLPFPCVQVSPVLSTLVRVYLLGMVPLPRLCFLLLSPSLRPVLSSSVTFSSASPPLPPASFPFLPFPFVQFSPVLSTLVRFVLPPSSRPLGVPTLSPFSFRIPGSAAPLSGLGFCGPQVAPKRPHTTPQERQK